MGVLQQDPIPKLCFAMALTICKDLFADCKDFLHLCISLAVPCLRGTCCIQCLGCINAFQKSNLSVVKITNHFHIGHFLYNCYMLINVFQF